MTIIGCPIPAKLPNSALMDKPDTGAKTRVRLRGYRAHEYVQLCHGVRADNTNVNGGHDQA